MKTKFIVVAVILIGAIFFVQFEFLLSKNERMLQLMESNTNEKVKQLESISMRSSSDSYKLLQLLDSKQSEMQIGLRGYSKRLEINMIVMILVITSICVAGLLYQARPRKQ
ncbi:MAG: hypothetical protein WDN75_09565 [Bacteroidota bacterium]